MSTKLDPKVEARTKITRGDHDDLIREAFETCATFFSLTDGAGGIYSHAWVWSVMPTDVDEAPEYFLNVVVYRTDAEGTRTNIGGFTATPGVHTMGDLAVRYGKVVIDNEEHIDNFYSRDEAYNGDGR